MEPKLYKIFTRDLCWYCDKAKELLNSYGLPYSEYNIESHPHARQELLDLVPGAKTVPQVFVGKKLIGGYDQLRKYAEESLGGYGDG